MSPSARPSLLSTHALTPRTMLSAAPHPHLHEWSALFRWRSGCWRASGGVVVVRSRPHTHSGSTTRSPYSVQGVLLLTFLTASRPAITQNKVPGWTSRLSTPSRSALPPARRKRWGSQFFFTIWITSSSWSTCPLPTRPGLCFTHEPQTHAYLKSVFRVRWILSHNISTVGSATRPARNSQASAPSASCRPSSC